MKITNIEKVLKFVKDQYPKCVDISFLDVGIILRDSEFNLIKVLDYLDVYENTN